MTEKLIPFNYAEFCKDTSRLRLKDGTIKPYRASVCLGDSVCVVWDGNKYAQTFLPHEFDCLRLAAKTRIVRVRFARGSGGSIYCLHDGNNPQYENLTRPQSCEWVSDIIEVEISE